MKHSFNKYLSIVKDRFDNLEFFKCKAIFSRVRPRYLLRAVFDFFLGGICFCLLVCILTIPVKDYYFDTFVYSPVIDSVSLNINLTIGSANLLTTYGEVDYDNSYDSGKFYYSLNNYRAREIHYGKKGLEIECILDSLKESDKYKNEYSSLEKHGAVATYIYSHTYFNSKTVFKLFNHPNKTQKHIIPIYNDKYISNAYYWSMTNPFIDSLYLQVVKDSGMYKMLSYNHYYLQTSHLQCITDDGFIQKEQESVTENLHIPSVESKKQLMGLIFAKEDISQAYFKFVVSTRYIDSYQINLHTRGGAIINNNPSEELKVLSLHDTQIIKKKCDSNYDETELHVSYPERNNIQYMRLFFLTMILGIFFERLIKNIGKSIKRKRNSVAKYHRTIPSR